MNLEVQAVVAAAAAAASDLEARAAAAASDLEARAAAAAGGDSAPLQLGVHSPLEPRRGPPESIRKYVNTTSRTS